MGGGGNFAEQNIWVVQTCGVQTPAYSCFDGKMTVNLWSLMLMISHDTRCETHGTAGSIMGSIDIQHVDYFLMVLYHTI